MNEFNTSETKGYYTITFETDDKNNFEKVQRLCRRIIDDKAKTIPVDWLEQQAEYYQRAHEAEVEENGYDAGRYYMQMYNAINTLIDTWESENG